jgi:plasmid stability protein
MKNITLKIDDETYRKARFRAAEEGTSVSAMVRCFLESLPENAESLEKHRRLVAALDEIYAEADAVASPREQPLTPLTRDEIYAERLR